MLITEIERTAIVAAHHKKPHFFRAIALKHIAYGEKITQTFGHLDVVHVDEAVVHPKTRHGHAVGTFALCNFVFMVRKLQICAATVDIK